MTRRATVAPDDYMPAREAHAPAGMVWVEGGTFRMGSDWHYPEEAPIHEVRVGGFWIDRTPVTNRQFREFVKATGHVNVAEIPPDPKDYPGALPHMLRPGSLVFTPPKHAVDLSDWSQWWAFKFGADWRRPYGPRSSISGLAEHPVVHVAYQDAEAYARWAGKELPTEAEWEFAARGGLDGAEFAWGDEFAPGGRQMANTWQGGFPLENTRLDGFDRTSPVTAFPPNGYGIRDMIGNVWEWTTDWFTAQHPRRRAEAVLHPRKSAWWPGRAELRPLPAADQDSTQGDQGRLAPVRAQLLSPLSPRRAPRPASRHVHEPRRLSLRHSKVGRTVSVTPRTPRRKAISRSLRVGFVHFNPANRVKSRSVVQTVAPCSIAIAARTASMTSGPTVWPPCTSPRRMFQCRSPGSRMPAVGWASQDEIAASASDVESGRSNTR